MQSTAQEKKSTLAFSDIRENLPPMLAALREKKPLILNLTNLVTMDFMANALLALGAAPLMSNADEEIAELVGISSAVNINIGTLDRVFMQRALLAAKTAQALKKIMVLDPVGAGASQLRSIASADLLLWATIVRGNGSEILSLEKQSRAGQDGHGNQKSLAHSGPVEHVGPLGVESTVGSLDAVMVAEQLANQGKIIIVSGREDYITDGQQNFSCPYGSSLMPSVTGMGCVLTAVVAAFAALGGNGLVAANMAVHFFALTGQVAAQSHNEPASFKTKFIDLLFAPDWQAIEEIMDYGGQQDRKTIINEI